MAEKGEVVKLDMSLAIEQCEKEMKLKYIGIGVVLILAGVLWYLTNVGLLAKELLWPSIVLLIGVLSLIKAFIKG